MSLYRDTLMEVTGITNADDLAAIEDIMRHDIFHSTLDWQTRDQILKAAKEAHKLWKLAYLDN
tara:strand:- start:343 stop:531 length:189 start_codon:yes stop_codon:yes gene_type:complete